MARDPDIDDDFEDIGDVETEGEGTETTEGDAEGHADEGGEGANQEDHVGEAADAGQGEGQRSPVRRSGRASDRIRALTEERQRDREELAATRGRLEALERQTQTRSSEQIRAEEEQRLALMSPDERVEYRSQQLERNMNNRLAQMQAQMQDTSDKATYDARAEVNPLYRKHASEVERIVSEHKARGVFTAREVALKHVLGDLMLKNAGRARTKATNRGEQQRTQQTARGTSGRGDVGSDRQRTGGKTARDRLEGVTF